MTRRKGVRADYAGAFRLDRGMQKLREGLFAAPWVCRECLGLDGLPSDRDILSALHTALHSMTKLRDDDELLTTAKTFVTAAYVLLCVQDVKKGKG